MWRCSLTVGFPNEFVSFGTSHLHEAAPILLANRAQSTSWKKNKAGLSDPSPPWLMQDMHAGEQREVVESNWVQRGGKLTAGQNGGSTMDTEQ